MFDAIVLAGGAARRLGGADKPALEVGGRSLLDRAVEAVSDAGRTVVAGPRRPTLREVVWCQEQPPGGGPVAALAAAVSEVRAETVVVLAADLPWVRPAVPLLVAALGERIDAAMLASAEGRRNYLAAAWRTQCLRAALRLLPQVSGAAARSLYDHARVVEVADRGGWSRDCDTWDEVAAARRIER